MTNLTTSTYKFFDAEFNRYRDAEPTAAFQNEVALERALNAARQESGGIPLQRIAEIICQELDYDAIALSDEIIKYFHDSNSNN